MRYLSLFRFVLSTAVGLVVVLAAAGASAQSLTGRLVNSLSGDPIPGAVVEIEGQRQQATSGADGSFAIDGLPKGTYHLIVRAQGYSSRRTEIAVPAAAPVTVQVDPELHFEEVVSVSPEARSAFDAFQPTSVLAGQELTKQLDVSLGDTLRNQPGVAVRSLGSAPARPVVRGLDGDRVLILQNGQRMGDLSSQSSDHGVALNPASAQRIEVVRGPATLLYGANAIGGLINVISEDIPMTALRGTKGTVMVDAATAGAQVGTAANMSVGNGRFALNAGGGGRRSSDMETPIGPIDNSQSRSAFGNVGLGWTGSKGFFGGSYAYDDMRYGVPVIEDGQVQLTPRRHALTIKSGADRLDSPFDSFRASLAHRRYMHEELEGTDVGTVFRNDTTELQVMASHRAMGRMKGSVGAWALDRSFDASGEEALAPPVGQHGLAAFLYEEITWPHVTIQFAGRVDHGKLSPLNEPTRGFTDPSGSVGLLLRPAAANEALTVAVSLARAARAPALEELFFFGPHTGNFAFEVGNPNLESENALGLDVSLRWRHRRVSGEATYFRNDIRNYIFPSPITQEEFDARLPSFEQRFPGRTLSGEVPEDLEIVEYLGADSVLQGVELHTDVQVTSRVAAEFGLDYVRGTLTDRQTPLPRIPPLRARAGLRYQHDAFQVGGEVTGAAAQERVFESEAPTAGYGLLKLFSSYSFVSGGATHTITARLDNAADRLYRNHLSRVREEVPEQGRSVRLLYSLAF